MLETQVQPPTPAELPQLQRPGIIVSVTPAEQAALAATYEAAIYDVWFDDGPRKFVVHGESDSCAEPFAVVTGYNPSGRETAATINEASNAMLEIELQGRGIRYALGSGHDESWTHDEPSFALFGLTQGQALGIARRFGQAAIFWWDGKRGSIAWT